MREIYEKDIGNSLSSLIKETDPVDEDIGILSKEGELLGVVITASAYEFFIKKVEEEEDRLDAETVDEFRESGEKDE